ncbi:hypothetical protein CIK86_01345 [Pseudoalteromonas sp. JB197]|nr:hypothetical protein CIK86_01345 [Pseudoalteromonas sp. JB197]
MFIFTKLLFYFVSNQTTTKISIITSYYWLIVNIHLNMQTKYMFRSIKVTLINNQPVINKKVL